MPYRKSQAGAAILPSPAFIGAEERLEDMFHRPCGNPDPCIGYFNHCGFILHGQ